ncbi:MAG TPA: DUF4129 domain-containing protein [Chloroflexota bacterium]|nr:DUF4129 domain-containing protein [Chloroflexota bacterium]
MSRRVVAAVAAVILLASLAGVRPAGAAGSSDVTQRDLLIRALAAVDRGMNGNSTARALASRDALAILSTDPDFGAQPWLLEPLRGHPPDLEVARTRLRAALAALDPPGISVGDPNAGRQALSAVLADPRFHPDDPSSYLPTWLVPVAVVVLSIVHAIQEMLANALDHLYAWLIDFFYSNAFTMIVLGLTVLIVPAVIFLYVRTVRSVLVAQASLPTEAEVSARSGPDLLEAARAAAARGEHREACHFAFLAALRTIEDRVAVHLDYSATNREQLRRLAGAPGPLAGSYAAALKPLIDRFDRIWYGQAEASEADFREIYGLAARLGEVTA